MQWSNCSFGSLSNKRAKRRTWVTVTGAVGVSYRLESGDGGLGDRSKLWLELVLKESWCSEVEVQLESSEMGKGGKGTLHVVTVDVAMVRVLSGSGDGDEEHKV